MLCWHGVMCVVPSLFFSAPQRASAAPPRHSLAPRRVRLLGRCCAGEESAATVVEPTCERLVQQASDERLRTPRHAALIMDGNSRWARRKGLAVSEGHAAGAEALRCAVRLFAQWGLPRLTVFAFSTDNWARPHAEVTSLFAVMTAALQTDLDELNAAGVSLHFQGNRDALPLALQTAMAGAEFMTRNNGGLRLKVCVNYSGRAALTSAARAIAAAVDNGTMALSDVSESALAAHMGEDVDLLIRSSGERRLSNFALWECAFAEMVFLEQLWPDVGEEELLCALREYSRRERRFGAASADNWQPLDTSLAPPPPPP
jgi:undecaprenyl diphosphate synthase